MVAFLALLAAGSPHQPAAKAENRTLVIHPAVRLVVNSRGDLLFEVRAAPGDGWSQLAARFATSPDDWQALQTLNGGGQPVRGRYYRIPYALLSDTYRFLGIASLFPDDRATREGWHHRVGTARLPIEEESLYRLAFWFTGDGENFRSLLQANQLQDPSLHPGQEIFIPAKLLREAFRPSPTRAAPVTYGRDAQGKFASYRLRRGEALYSAVVLRFTGRVDPDEVEQVLQRIVARSRIDDVADIPAGFSVKIPLDDLAEEFLPPTDPRRVELEMNRLLASRYQSEVRSQDLSGITVILDPGHGGVDIGTRQNGVWEDDTVYDIAVRLQKKLRQHTAAQVKMTLLDPSQKDQPYDFRFRRIDRDEVILTHPHHLAVDSATRAMGVNLRVFLANSIYRAQRKKPAKDEKIIFLSIHADALHRSVRGAMVYVPGERYRRGRYGASGAAYRKYREVREKPHVSFTRAQRLRSEGLSRQLARTLLKTFKQERLAIHSQKPIRDHVVRHRRSWLPAVLRGNEVPIKILLEVANIANQTEARLLSRPEYRDRIADALLHTLLTFYRGRDQSPVS
ncbi:MAG: N-acetylmuramoyl-L-alanine amidase [Acidobacteriota bacterium]